MYKHFFFDLDNTLTRSRSLVTSDMKRTLNTLMGRGCDVIVVSGARVEQARYQLDNTPCFYLGQNGNHAYDGESKKDIWRHTLSETQKKEIFNHIQSIPRSWDVSNESDLIEDRECQISYSLIGHHEDIAKKEAFDSASEKRREFLVLYPLRSDTVEVKIGGTTCFDYIQKGKHKGFNVEEFILRQGWIKNECVYVGDALFPGGNDETVVGVIDTKAVKNPDDTLEYLKSVKG